MKFRKAKNLEIAHKIKKRLSKWNAYIYHVALTGSVYIKFPHWKLGSIRIADHDGRQKYHYTWTISTDKKWRPERSFLWDSLEVFAQAFERHAERRGVKPGDTETWKERIECRTTQEASLQSR
jgi:hypothetical protein